MNENQLSKRLEKAGEFVPKNSRLADIGSDHAYLPVALVLQEKIEFAVAGEVVQGPFESAKKQVAKNQLSQHIHVRLADGLDAIEAADQISAITICGMGGVLIRDILAAGASKQKLSGTERLILQPNIGEAPLRSWLMQQGYTILDETILEEKNKRYEIIVAEKTNQKASYTEKELLFGPILLEKKSDVFRKKWQLEQKQREYVIAQLENAAKQNEEKLKQFKKELSWIEEVLAE